MAQNNQYNNNYNLSNYQPGGPVEDMFPSLWPNKEDMDRAVSSCLARVFLRMFAALLVTAAAAFAVSELRELQMIIFDNLVVFIVLIIAELALVITISARINRLSPTVATVLFFLYAIINGLTLSSVFLLYNVGIIFHAFAISALMFAAMAIFGAVTKRDLSKVGSICFMGLIGIIIASVVNIFFSSDLVYTIVSYIGVILFVALTAYDTQRIKRMLEGAKAESSEIAIKRVSITGALSLYLDFINLFLYMLRLLGRRK